MTPPRATYRLQLRPGFGFAQVGEIADYLGDLGVSHAYLSPSLQAVPGSTHGYDVVDPTRVSEDLGGPRDHARMSGLLAAAGLGQVLDIVPNHLAVVTPHNRWWWDVLANGRSSPYARVFDVDWEAGGGRVVVPVLGAPLDQVLAAGELRLAVEDGEEVLRYHEHVFPLAAGSSVGSVDADGTTLRGVLDRQHYRLAYWLAADSELNYRRFFDVAELGGVRVEDPEVFAATHDLVVAWVSDGAVDGLRVDHPDGLRDPAGYFERLRRAAPDAWVVAEKILEPTETLRDWPIAGTTGYEFCNLVLRLFVDGAGEEPLARLHAAVTGEEATWPEVVEEAKRHVLDAMFAGEVEGLARRLGAVDVASADLRAAIRELIVWFPVYRTYANADTGEVAEADREAIDAAHAAARDRRPDLESALDLLRATLLLEAGTSEFVLRFQQLTGAVMAKGVEDTAFYRWLPLVALNEVGGDPSRFGATVGAFHEWCAYLAREWPASMLTTSTHDTKRSEDVRARLALLSEVPDGWAAAVRRWMATNAVHRRGAMPSGAAEYLAYQTLVGAWPIDADRLAAYLLKATREEKRHSSWRVRSEEYEAAVESFARSVLQDRDFVADLEAFVAPLVEPGRVNSLAQALLKLTAPGVPDVYQGCELWDLSLVDPDNRRPVDFERRRALLAELAAEPAPEAILARMDEGLPKLWVTRQALHLRREHTAAFEGGYEPLVVEGAHRDHAVAFLRGGEVAVVVPRLVMGLGGAFADWDWDDTTVELPPGRWHDRLAGTDLHGGTVPAATLLARFPVALLVRTA